MTKLEVSEFYKQSFEQLSQFERQSFEQFSRFYSESFSHLMTYATGFAILIITVAGWYISRQSKASKKRFLEMEKKYDIKLKEDLDKFREDYDAEKEKFENKYKEEKLLMEQDIIKTKEEFKKRGEDLDGKIQQYLVFSTALISDQASKFSISLIQLEFALNLCLLQKLDDMFFVMVTKRIKACLLKIEVASDLEGLNLEIVISKLKEHKKDNTLFQNMVSDFENAYNEALKRLK